MPPASSLPPVDGFGSLCNVRVVFRVCVCELSFSNGERVSRFEFRMKCFNYGYESSDESFPICDRMIMYYVLHSPF